MSYKFQNWLLTTIKSFDTVYKGIPSAYAIFLSKRMSTGLPRKIFLQFSFLDLKDDKIFIHKINGLELIGA